MENNSFALTESEEKSFVGILYNHITYSTTMEVFGELSLEGIQRIDVLRSAFVKLIKKYALTETVPEDAYLLLGIKEFVSGEALVRWVTGSNAHLKKRADYFQKKWM